MGTYNTTEARFECPRCRALETFRVDLYFGDTSQLQEVVLGEVYPFRPRTPPDAGGPPPGGSGLGMGYAECPACARDSHCLATIEDHRLVCVAPDMEHPPFIPDATWEARIACPVCESTQTLLQTYEGSEIGRFECAAEGCGATCFVRHDDSGNATVIPYDWTAPWNCAR